MNLQEDDMIQCGIVGWKDSGKTFLAQRLIEYFSRENIIVGWKKIMKRDLNFL